MHHLSGAMRECLDNCTRCHETCLGMLMTHCLEVGGKHVAPDHVRIMMACAKICQTSADFMIMNSAHHPHVCRECAEICRQCARSCEEVGDMQDCVDACRRCAESCEKMAA